MSVVPKLSCELGALLDPVQAGRVTALCLQFGVLAGVDVAQRVLGHEEVAHGQGWVPVVLDAAKGLAGSRRLGGTGGRRKGQRRAEGQCESGSKQASRQGSTSRYPGRSRRRRL